jgi:spore germination protein KB
MNDKISTFQFALIVCLFTTGTSILTLPQGLAVAAKQDSWIAALLSLPLGVLVVWLFSKVSNLYPNITLVQINEKIFGKWVGNIISSLFIFFALKNAAAVLFYVGQFLVMYVMPKTPIQAIMILQALIVAMGMRLGLEVLARDAETLFPWFVFLFIILVLFISPQISFDNIQPIFENGIKPIFKATLNMTSVTYFAMIVLLMIFPSCMANPNQAKKAFYAGAVIGGMNLVVLSFLCITVLGAEETARYFYVSYVLARKINIGNSIQRIEAIIAGMFFISMYFKLTFYFYACTIGLAQVLKLKDYRLLVIPLTMILIVFGLVSYPNIIYQGEWDSTIWIPYSITMCLFYPLLLLMVAKIKAKWKGINSR